MAYSRFGNDSDMYIWNDGIHYNIIANCEEESLPHFQSKYNNPKDLYNEILKLQSEGYKVTRYTLNRIRKEIDND
jgi:hypothetical protein